MNYYLPVDPRLGTYDLQGGHNIGPQPRLSVFHQAAMAPRLRQPNFSFLVKLSTPKVSSTSRESLVVNHTTCSILQTTRPTNAASVRQ